MPVRKFRTLQDMEDALCERPATLLCRTPSLVSGISRLASPSVDSPPGVYRHRSIDEAQQLPEEWEEENFRAFWERRRKNR